MATLLQSPIVSKKRMRRTRKVTVLGFGGRSPRKILDVISKLAVAGEDVDTEIEPIRSQSIESSLLKAPYRTFLKNIVNISNNRNKNSQEDKKTKQEAQEPCSADVLFYCLPTSITEYLQWSDETARVRDTLLRQLKQTSSSSSPGSSGDVVVAVYDPIKDKILIAKEDPQNDNDDDDVAAAAIMAAAATNDQATTSLISRSLLMSSSLVALSDLDVMVAEFCRYRRPIEEQSQQGAVVDNGCGLVGNDIVILVGSGGREHALAVSLAKSPMIQKVICCPGNGGTRQEKEGGMKICNRSDINTNNDIIQLTKDVGATMVVIGPEAPLVDGLVNMLHEQCPNVMAFGPTQEAAILEASKAFTKDFLQKHGIPTAKYRVFTDAQSAIQYVKTLDDNDRQVVKASGLAAGKGVLIPTTKEETIHAVQEIMSDRAFGDAGDTCVIESFLTGPEASCLAFCDGKTARLLPAAQDHKRALDGDLGLNTGGMGAYAPAPCVTPAVHKIIEDMCITTVQKMAERGTPYVGVLYAGMMLTPNDGPYVLEFNCRFGDPETQVVLPLLETDLYEVLKACCTGSLDKVDVRFRDSTAAATIVCAAKGYPQKYPKGMEITGLDVVDDDDDGVKVYHAGTKVDDAAGITRCSGGRVLAVTGVGTDLRKAIKTAYSGVKKLDFVDTDGNHLMHYRNDIGKRAVEKKLRIGVLGSTRGTALIPIIEACTKRTDDFPAEIVAVISNKSTAPILDKGRALGSTVVSKFISSKGLTREQYDAECTAELVSAGVEYVLLVGYMRILSKPFTEYWKGRCINVHPSLLPKHAGGMDIAVHQAVIYAKETESGCTIHEVTEEVDGGPIVVQKRVKVDPGETAESLKAKVQAQEGIAFMEAIEMYCRRGATVVSYADAGVSIDAGNRFVDIIKPLCKATRRPGCDADLGGFGGFFDLAAAGYDSADTVIIGATDGVGTKLRIAQATENHETIGIDLVAMCVNDLIVAGGEPLFFLDYYATGNLNVQEAAAVVKGIAEGCQQAGCGLIGGETAEMPSMYASGDYDLAGFSVGAVHRNRILPQGVSEGDVLLGLTSSGIHSNGFSLVRKLVEKEGLSFSSPCPWGSGERSIGEDLLTPTKIYVKSVLSLIKSGKVKALAHITGGGILENVPRSLPGGLAADISYLPPLPPVFGWVKKASGLEDSEMLRTFNCGIGMVLIVAKEENQEVLNLLRSSYGENDACQLGMIVKGDKNVHVNVGLIR